MTIRLQSGGVPENLKSIYPNPASVLSWVEFLRQHRLSIFADEARDAKAAAQRSKFAFTIPILRWPRGPPRGTASAGALF
jgi:hypothetical protein